MADESEAAEAQETAEEPQGGEPEGGKATESGGEDVRDSHGQPGINKERHDKEMAAKDAEIADLRKQLDEAAKTEQGRKDLEDKIAKLEASQAEERVAHKLELAGCVDLKAAKARLDDFDGDVAKLKEGCPYLFAKDKQTGTTGKPPAGASKAMDEKLDKIFGV